MKPDTFDSRPTSSHGDTYNAVQLALWASPEQSPIESAPAALESHGEGVAGFPDDASGEPVQLVFGF